MQESKNRHQRRGHLLVLLVIAMGIENKSHFVMVLESKDHRLGAGPEFKGITNPQNQVVYMFAHVFFPKREKLSNCNYKILKGFCKTAKIRSIAIGDQFNPGLKKLFKL